MRLRSLRLPLLMLLALAAVACGNKGELVRPEPQGAATAAR